MTVGGTLRRVVVFTAVFGGGLGLLAWAGGGVLTPSAGGRSVHRPETRPGEVLVPVTPGAGMGRGHDVRISRDAVAVVEGLPEPVSYRAFEAQWKKQTPLESGTLEARRLRTEAFSALFLHRRPTLEEPRPPAIEGPETTRVDADEADIELDDRTGEFRAELQRNVVVVRHDVGGDLVVRTERLSLEQRNEAEGEKVVHAATDAPVTVTGQDLELSGTGLLAAFGKSASRTGDDGAPASVTLHRNVRATTAKALLGGASPAAGTNGETVDAVTTITCSGAAELVELVPATERKPGRWRATFRDDVEIRSAGAATVTCDLLIIEFRRAPIGDARSRAFEPEHVIADGNVLFIGTGETGDTWRLAAARAETVTTPRGGLDTTLTGGTELTFAGTLRGGGTERGRVEIRSAGPARMHSDALPQPGRTQSRGSIVFEQDVIVDQWAETGELETHIEAPELTIGGFWSNDPGGDGRLDPETLTASGTADKRVLIERGAGLDLVAHCQVLTWRVHRDTQLERLLLGGRPSVRFTDTSGMVPTGQGEAGVAATVFVDAKESIEFQWRHGLAADSSAADDPTRPFATVAASGDVLLRRAVDERESYRISARAIDVAFDADQEVRGIHAYDNVEMAGTGDTPGAPRVVLRGDRLSAERDPDLGTDERVRSTVFVFGDASRPAEARVEETHGPQGVLRPKPIEHVLRGEQLRYEEGGTRLIARRSARAEIDADRQEHSDRSAPPLPGNLTVRAGEIVAHLDPAAAELTRGGDLRKLVATGGVSITAGDTYVVTGDTIEYDHVAAQAIARGRPARSVRKGVAGRDDFVNSDEIHVAFARQANGKPEPQRVTCDGGMIQIFQPVKDDEPPRRLVITADGPIEMLSSSGSATGDVRMTVNEISPSGAAQQRAALTAERVDLTFDPTARNRPASERLQRAVAVGSTGRPVRLVTTDRTATADRAELTGPWIDLTSPFGNPVHVIEHGPPRSEMVCDSARYNLRTNDFNMIRARVATEGR